MREASGDIHAAKGVRARWGTSRFRETLVGSVCVAVLLWINIYICRDLFTTPATQLNSMQGSWIALAKRAGSSWFHATWWPYWDGGNPFEFTYAPLVPGLTAAWSAMGSSTLVSTAHGFMRLTYRVRTILLVVL